MKIIDCEQRTPEWYEARIGKISASLAWKLISSAGKVRTGKTPDAYMNALLAERLTRKPTFIRQTDAMERGSIMEAEAREWYERRRGVSVRQVGFAIDDTGSFGCSPDGIMEGNGLEIKCPGLPVFMEIATANELPEAHYVQVQTCMQVFQVDRWDYVAYTDVRGLRPVLIDVHKNPTFCASLCKCLLDSAKELDRREAVMRKYGHGVPADTPIDMSDFNIEPTDEEIEGMQTMTAADL
jgi:hypothetical protein